MTVAETLQGYYAAHAGVAALVGARIYPIRWKQGTEFPCLTFQRISGALEYSHSGPSGLTPTRWQLTCWARTYTAAEALAIQVVAATNAYPGATGEAAFAEFGPDAYNPEAALYQLPVDVTIEHRG